METNFVCFAAFLILILAAIGWGRVEQQKFKDRFPPISEAEFVALCSPGSDPAVALRVRKILSESLNVDYERIYPSSRLMADLGAE